MKTELQQTPLAEEHRQLGARLVPFAGWNMPVQYEGIKCEHKAVRERAGLFDVSHMGELWLRGPDALKTADYLVTNDVQALPVGKALYTVCCNDAGMALDDLIVYHVANERVLIVCNAGNRDKISAHVASVAKDRCSFEDTSDITALIALQGPAAQAIFAKAGAGALSELAFFHVAEGHVAGVSCLVARTGYTGEDGFEVFCANEDAVALWRALLEAGQEHGIAPAGLGARDTLRLEAKLPLYGHEIDETTHPFEAKLGWVVKLDAADFIGKEALVSIKQAGYARRLVGFEMVGRGIARQGYTITSDGKAIGRVTSGSPSPTLGKHIGLGYVPQAFAAVGTALSIEIRGKHVDAVVVKTPFYKRQKRVKDA